MYRNKMFLKQNWTDKNNIQTEYCKNINFLQGKDENPASLKDNAIYCHIYAK